MTAKRFARATGAVYLVYFVTAIGGGLLSGGVAGLGSASVDAIHRSTYQLGVAIGEVSTVLYLTLVVLLFRLLSGVNHTAAWLALVFGVTGCAIAAVGAAFEYAALSDPSYLKLNAAALHVALVFFAGFDMFIGYLVYRSEFLPRLIGVLMLVAGVGWLTALGPAVPAPVAAIGGLAELALMLWLLIVGVREKHDTERIHDHEPDRQGVARAR